MSNDHDFDIETVSYYANVTTNYPDVEEIKKNKRRKINLEN